MGFSVDASAVGVGDGTRLGLDLEPKEVLGLLADTALTAVHHPELLAFVRWLAFVSADEVLLRERTKCVRGKYPDDLLADVRVRVLEPLGIGALAVALVVDQLHGEREVKAHGFDEDFFALCFRGGGQIDAELLSNSRNRR